MFVRKLIPFILFAIIFSGCDPIVTEFEETSDPDYYNSTSIKSVSAKDTIKVVTWNIRFGATRLPWFGDSCGDRVILTEDETLDGLNKIASKIKEMDPDILFLQEADVQSKRTGYEDQVQWILDNTDLNYAVYGSMWEAQVVPSDGLGRVNTGNAILSKWKISDAVRHQLPLRGDQDALVQLFYLRRNILTGKISIGDKEIYAASVHSTAFATDDTKKRHIEKVVSVLDEIDADGYKFIMGGDLNTLPPNATKVEYCDEDYCSSDELTIEELHADNEHREGSYFNYERSGSLEKDWIGELYSKFTPAVSLNDYLANESVYFTHTPDYSSESGWDRKLDYLFTNGSWVAGSDFTHQEAVHESDHIPVSALWVVQ